MTGPVPDPITVVPYGTADTLGLDASVVGTRAATAELLSRAGLPTVIGITVGIGESSRLAAPDAAAHAVATVESASGAPVAADGSGLLLRLAASTAVPTGGIPAAITVLGLTADNFEEHAQLCGDRNGLAEAFTTTIRVIGENALEVPADEFADVALDIPGAVERIAAFLTLCEKHGTRPFPRDPAEQVALAATATLTRWAAPRARRGRTAQGLPADLALALHLEAMRLGPRESTGTGSAVSRAPESPGFMPSVSYRPGLRRPAAGVGPAVSPGNDPSLPAELGDLSAGLLALERELRAVVLVDFEVVGGTLSFLDVTTVDRPGAQAGLGLFVDLVEAGVLTAREAVQSVSAAEVESMLHPQLRLSGDEVLVTSGLAASPGAAVGKVALSSDVAAAWSEAGESVVLVMDETSPSDLAGMLGAAAILTARGGVSSHAAVVARGLGRPAICGASGLSFDRTGETVTAGDHVLRQGDIVSVSGTTGAVYLGAVAVVPATPSPALRQLLSWADQFRRLMVRTNADNARDTEVAIGLGAEGIGLCRTEHQFLGDRLPLVRRFLLAETPEAEAVALQALGEGQHEDFRDLLRAVGDRPVTVRLLDAPLHEFLPSAHDHGGPTRAADRIPTEEEAAWAAATVAWREANPMLGARGVRLAVLRPLLYPTQVRALLHAWVDVAAEGIHPQLEIMIPLVSLVTEFELAVRAVHEAAAEVIAETGIEIPYRVGCMIETPRAALIAGKIAASADFLSFGTNDLTQLTYGFSRDDVESRVLSVYIQQGLMAASPFARVDDEGVTELIGIAAQRSRGVKPGIKLGVCGEQGGDPASVTDFENLGLDSISCSPHRVPVARLAAAQAALAAQDAAASL